MENSTHTYRIMLAWHLTDIAKQCIAKLEEQDLPHTPVCGLLDPSCTALWNRCVEKCPTEIVIICNQKARPTRANVNRLLELLDAGHGIVGLHHFGFFGFYKEVLRRIGLFDERFVGGWFEDNDVILRLQEANLSYYEAEELEYLDAGSAWTWAKSFEHFKNKWRLGLHGGAKYLRALPELPPAFDLGPSQPRNFLPWSASVLTPMQGLVTTSWDHFHPLLGV